eukprot:scaffold858_cov123-Cylindrotheca_fusiformis.AAC.16
MKDDDTILATPKMADQVMENEPARKRFKTEESVKGEQSEEAETSVTKTKSRAKTKSKSHDHDMSWICGECKEADCMMDPSCSEFLICDGQCERVFHYPCAGLSKLPDSDEDWICKDCTRQQHQCAICHDYGKDNEDVFRCKKEKCGLFFHESCLQLQDVDVTMVPASATSSVSSENDGNLEPCSVPVFTCPAHHCWTCTQDDMIEKEKEKRKMEASATNGQKKRKKKRKKKQVTIFKQKTESRLYRCLYCPVAYHLTCLPPTSRFHELAVLCHQHALTHKLPDLDLTTSLQGQVESKIDEAQDKLSGFRQMRKQVRKGANPFFLGLRGDRLTKQEKEYVDYVAEKHGEAEADRVVGFCLPCEFKNEVNSKPPSYKHLHGLKYDPDHKPKKTPLLGEKCQCEKLCDENCFNRLGLEECFGEGQNSNCNVGGDCGNRSLSRKQYVKCKPKREGGKGWGLVAVSAVPKGKLVQEYVGEVIDEATKERRLTDWNKEHPNDPNFYVMAISNDWYVDAREYANMSRFINHSCEPNCKVITMNVKGYRRNGIYSLRDIAAGEFLSYDYKFETSEGDRFICRCGAQKCRGTMKGGDGLGNKRELSWKEAKAQYEIDKKFLDDVEKQGVLSQVDELVPGASKPDEYVSYGPLEHKRATILHDRVFLWRNAKLGADFVSRNSRLGASKPTRSRVSRPETRTFEYMDAVALLKKHNGLQT